MGKWRTGMDIYRGTPWTSCASMPCWSTDRQVCLDIFRQLNWRHPDLPSRKPIMASHGMSSWFTFHFLQVDVCPFGSKSRKINQHTHLSSFHQKYHCKNLKLEACGIKLLTFEMLYSTWRAQPKLSCTLGMAKQVLLPWCDWVIIIVWWGELHLVQHFHNVNRRCNCCAMPHHQANPILWMFAYPLCQTCRVPFLAIICLLINFLEMP